MARRYPRASAARRLHRSVGAMSAAFVIFMVVSGLAINHSPGLNLESRTISSSLLLDHYGLEAPGDIRSFALGDGWLSFAGSQVYLNEDNVASLSGGVGAVASNFAIVVAGADELIMLDQQGTLIERIPRHLLLADSGANSAGGPIESVGLLEDKRVIVASAGTHWLADEALLNWQNTADIDADISWAIPGETPETLSTSITRNYRGEGLSLERVLLDFHSGRIFGSIGVLVYDLLALAIGGLAISGLVFWLQGRRNGRNSRKGNPLKG